MPKEPEVTTTVNELSVVPQWISEMQKHFQEHGFYRPEDLDRVLGNPETRVEVQVSNTTGINTMVTK